MPKSGAENVFDSKRPRSYVVGSFSSRWSPFWVGRAWALTGDHRLAERLVDTLCWSVERTTCTDGTFWSHHTTTDHWLTAAVQSCCHLIHASARFLNGTDASSINLWTSHDSIWIERCYESSNGKDSIRGTVFHMDNYRFRSERLGLG